MAKRSKGQIAGIDILFALVAFSLLFAMYSAWASQLSPVEANDEPAFLLASARQMLFEGPGNPPNWNSADVKVPGIVSQRLVINGTKLSRFLALNYSQQARLLGAGGYDFYFELARTNGTVLFSAGLNGSNRPTSAQARVIVIYNGAPAVSTLRLSR